MPGPSSPISLPTHAAACHIAPFLFPSDQGEVNEYQIACDYALTAHIRRRGDYRAHFWIVANAVALSCKVRSLWLNQYRSILVRWQDLAAPCQAMLQIVCAVTAWKVASL